MAPHPKHTSLRTGSALSKVTLCPKFETHPLGFTGEWFDAGVGMTYLRTRWYNGAAGRFTSRDTVATSSFYRYASNNPINRVDPTGYLACSRYNIQDGYGTCTIETGDYYYKIARELIAAGIDGSESQLAGDLYTLNQQQYPDRNNIPVLGSLTLRAEWILALEPLIGPYLPPPTIETHGDPLVDILYELGGVNDLEAMARISEVLARRHADWPTFLDEMSETLLGVRIHGPGSLMAATSKSGCHGLGRDCQNDEPQFSDTGFHPDFQDEGNQLYHVWGYIAETASPENPHGEWIAHAGNQFHECVQSDAAILLYRMGTWDLVENTRAEIFLKSLADKAGGGTS